MRIVSFQARVLCHATEDDEKVLNSFKRILPEGLQNSINIQAEDLEGYYGDQIKLFKMSIKTGDLQQVLENILSKLSMEDRVALKSSLESSSKKKQILFLRLSKQSAMMGEIKVTDMDPIWIKMVIEGSRKEVEEFLEGSKNCQGDTLT